jgi:hypothetical protein
VIFATTISSNYQCHHRQWCKHFFLAWCVGWRWSFGWQIPWAIQSLPKQGNDSTPSTSRRLSREAWRPEAALQQLSQALELLQQQQASNHKDRRQSMLCKGNGDLDTSMIYVTLKLASSSEDPWANFVWKNKAPPRVQFFTWLLSKGRIQCKTNLIKKRIVNDNICDICQQVEET